MHHIQLLAMYYVPNLQGLGPDAPLWAQLLVPTFGMTICLAMMVSISLRMRKDAAAKKAKEQELCGISAYSLEVGKIAPFRVEDFRVKGSIRITNTSQVRLVAEVCRIEIFNVDFHTQRAVVSAHGTNEILHVPVQGWDLFPQRETGLYDWELVEIDAPAPRGWREGDELEVRYEILKGRARGNVNVKSNTTLIVQGHGRAA